MVQVFLPYMAYMAARNREIESYLDAGWVLQGSPFQGRPDEFWQVVVRRSEKSDKPLVTGKREVSSGGSLSALSDAGRK